MRTLAATLATVLTGTVPLCAQEPPAHELVTLEIDVSPPQNDSPTAGTWVEPDESGFVPSNGLIRIRAQGHVGGWYHPVLDVGLTGAAGSAVIPAWVGAGAPAQASALNWHGALRSTADANHYAEHEHTFQRYINMGFLNGTTVAQADGVKNWCQPFVSPPNAPGLVPSTRLWTAESPLWGLTAAGQMHRNMWRALLEDIAQGVSPYRTTCISSAAALRQALVLQSLYINASVAPAQQYLQSPAFGDALRQGKLYLSIQPFAARHPNLPTSAMWPQDEQVPPLSPQFVPPPKFTLGKNVKQVILWGYQHTNAHWLHGLAGRTLTAGTWVSFDAPTGSAPLVLIFPTTSGNTAVEAIANPELLRPSRYDVLLPTNLISGSVEAKAGADQSFTTLGTIIALAQSK